MGLQRLIIDTGSLSDNGFKSVCDLSPGQLPALQNLTNYLQSMPDQQNALISVQVGAVQASGTLTFTTTGPANTQTATICGVTFTALTSGHVTGEATFNRNNTVATAAANLAAAINQYAPFSGIVTASSSLGVVTVTCAIPGVVGNGLVIANVDFANTAVSSFANGSDGTSYSLDLR